ncbi:MAG: SprT-like domain-containing protein [candidate division Zixibacteria bacterium]|nr:SprT-like domain-containing protein [candidate division Zixibacteria bacterium]
MARRLSPKSPSAGKSSKRNGKTFRRFSLKQRFAQLLNFDLFGADPVMDGRIHSISRDRQGEGVDMNAAPENLPEVGELYRLFDLFNLLHFDGKLPNVRLSYSTRMLSAGSCSPLTPEIKLGVRYHQIFHEELTDTLKHEMIHLVHYYHDAAFQAKAEEMGVSMHAQSHPDLRRPSRYVYECPECRKTYPRQKRFRMVSCGDCSDGSFEKRFKLRLVGQAKAC